MWDMQKRVFQGLKRTFMHVSGLPPPKLDKKKTIFMVIGFLIKTGWGNTWDMHKTCVSRPETLVHACIRSYPTLVWLRKTITLLNFFFLIETSWRKIWDMQNVRFRAWNAHLCMSQVFPTIFWFKKAKLYNLVFLNQIMMENSWDIHKRAFQGLKRTFMHVSNLPPPYFNLKNQFIKYCFLSKFGGGRPET